MVRAAAWTAAISVASAIRMARASPAVAPPDDTFLAPPPALLTDVDLAALFFAAGRAAVLADFFAAVFVADVFFAAVLVVGAAFFADAFFAAVFFTAVFLVAVFFAADLAAGRLLALAADLLPPLLAALLLAPLDADFADFADFDDPVDFLAAI